MAARCRRRATGLGPEHLTLSDSFRRFAELCRRDGAPTYARICDGAAADDELLAVVAHAAPDQQRPNILLAAVHYLLLAGTDHPLARHYATLSATPHPDGDPYEDFADFCRTWRGAVTDLVTRRATQTNEVGRCTFLLPALVDIANRTGGQLALLDLGAAAGLHLLFDRYTYDYGSSLRVGTGSSVVLHCDVRAGRLPALRLPAVAARLGIDRSPIDATDPDEVQWLLACAWPDHLDRFRALQAAVEVARRAPPTVRTGDMVDDLDASMGDLPADAHVCVMHTWVAAYLTEARQAALTEAVMAWAARRPLSWLFAEYPYEVPGLAMPSPPRTMPKVRGATALVVVEDGAPRRLADVHPHGRWMHWYG